MIRNYFLVALRNLTRHKFFSAINIFGLAISMSVCLGIIMLVADQLTYDRYNQKRDRIHRIVTQNLNPDGSESGNDYATSPLALAETLTQDFTGIEKAVRFKRGFGNGWIEFDQDINIPLGGFFADPEALSFFEYELEYGNETTALVEPYSVVLTKKAAKKLFKQENPVGEVIKVGELGEYKVTGIIREADHKSHIVFEALASYSTLKSLEANGTVDAEDLGWGNFTAGWVYLLLEEGQSSSEIERHLAKIAKEQRPKARSTNYNRSYRFYLQNIAYVTPGPFINNPIGPFMPRIFVYFFGGLALIVMLTSCFNYTNLSIARSLTRAREIGVRKVNGAQRYQIFFQFLCESVLLSVFALALALGLLVAVKPFLLNLKFAQVLKWDLEGNLYVYAVFLGFSVLVGMMAGFFPAVILSKFQPVKVLKGAGGALKLFSRLGLRKTLLVAQFSLSLIFIISVLLLYNQLKLFLKADHGFEMTNKINIHLKDTPYDALKSELYNHGNIENVAAASHVPAAGTTYGEGYKRNLSDTEGIAMDYFLVDENYLENMNIKLIAGRNFEADAREANRHLMLINESAVKAFNFATPHDAIGEFVFQETDSAKFEVIGVVKDYNHQVLMERISPMALRCDTTGYNLLQVKYSGGYEDAAKTIEESWVKTNPNLKLDYKDFEGEVRLFYRTIFSDFVSIIGIIAVMAILISCLGLLGMATYTIETKMKEISIRKVLGCTDGALILLLSKGFLTLLVIAIFIAVPMAWFINNLWLELIAYRTELGFGVIGGGVLILLILGGLTIASQTLRAAFTNPVDSLRNE
ncbi:MAG: ABC transporter permease [Bacteroidota bacterium]